MNSSVRELIRSIEMFIVTVAVFSALFNALDDLKDALTAVQSMPLLSMLVILALHFAIVIGLIGFLALAVYDFIESISDEGS